MELYGKGARGLQDEHDTRRLADRIESKLVRDHLSDDDRAFVERLDMFFLASVGEDGMPSCSYKGGDPGFVRAVDAHTILFPSYDGNGMFLSLGNIAERAPVGLLFIDFAHPKRLRVQGRAAIDRTPEASALFHAAQLVVRVAVERVFPNCPRYIHHLEKTERSPYVPTPGETPPVPGWKRADWASDVLPAGDPARRKEEP